MKKNVNHSFTKQLLANFIDFLKILIFIFLFSSLFGMVNTLPAVALGVAFIMFPKVDYKIQPQAMFFITLLLFPLGSIVAQFSHSRPVPLAIIYFGFLVLILALSLEPDLYKFSIPFLLNFIFCQSAPVANDGFLSRFFCLLIGSLFVASFTYLKWYKKKIGQDGRSLRLQIKASLVHKTYILKMATSVSFAMYIGIIFDFPKPLWISIVAMSLTEISFKETTERITHRLTGTILGSLLFYFLFVLIIPENFRIFFIFALGYLSYFLPSYKHKTIINAICALNASLIILGSTEAIFYRIMCFGIGVIIVLTTSIISHAFSHWYQRYAIQVN